MFDFFSKKFAFQEGGEVKANLERGYIDSKCQIFLFGEFLNDQDQPFETNATKLIANKMQLSCVDINHSKTFLKRYMLYTY